MSNKIKLSKEDRPVAIDNNLPFDKFIKKYARREDVYFKHVSASVNAVTEAARKAHARPAYVIENLALKVDRLAIGLDDRSLPDTFVFRNCTFLTPSDTDTSFIALLAMNKAEFVNCSFKATGRTCFTVEPYGDLNLTGSDAHTLLVQGQSDSDVRIDYCDISQFFAASAENLHFVSKLPYTASIDQTTSVSVSYVDEYPEHPAGSWPSFVVKNGTNGAIAAIRIADSNLAANRIVSIQYSVYTVYVSRSHINTLVIWESLIRQLRTPSSTVDMLKTVESTLIDQFKQYGKDELRHTALTKSNGFPDRPMILYKKAKIRIPSLNPFSRKCVCRGEVIVKLSVPSTALRHYDPMSKKIRVSEAVVVGFYDTVRQEIKLSKLRRLLKRYSVTSFRTSDFKYWLNRKVTPVHPFDDDDSTCASGIHGFLDFADAASYSWP